MVNMRPAVFLFIAFAILWLGLWLGSWIMHRVPQKDQEADLLKTVEGASLTLLALLLGFTFSMAVSRYELRKDLIISEANAIGTTWLRTAILPEPTRTEEQQLLRQYVPARIEFLASGNAADRMQASLVASNALEARLWAIASSYAADHRDALSALFLTTLNQAIDLSESRTAAFENRIPVMAWVMLLLLGFAAMAVVGVRVNSRSTGLRIALPLVIALVMAMTLDLDSPRYGVIRATQPSMERVAELVAGPPPQAP
ncbi:MAG TPA: hypothetical protein VGM11_15670 [Acidobacteriaceae bacterium]|jgi:hypothetical protein